MVNYMLVFDVCAIDMIHDIWSFMSASVRLP